MSSDRVNYQMISEMPTGVKVAMIGQIYLL